MVLQAWLAAYHTPDPQRSTARAGALQHAFVVEVAQASIGGVQIKLLGHDGQLPALDLPQLAAFYARNTAGIQPQAEVTHPGPEAWLSPQALPAAECTPDC